MLHASYKLKFLFSSLLAFVFSSIALSQTTSSTDGMVTFSVRTVTNNGTYSPKNVVAIWVKNVQGDFVISRKVMANNRKKHLLQWVASSGNSVVNAVTGATLSSHQQHTINWDCRDQDGDLVPDGNYEIFVEFTERNSANGGAAGPSTKVLFTKGPGIVSLAPADETYFKDIQLNYSPLNVGIELYSVKNLRSTVFPNPFSDFVRIGFDLPIQAYIQIAVYDEHGKRIKELVDGEFPVGEQFIEWDGKTDNGRKVAAGVYYLRFFYQGKMSTHKLLKAY
jgi:flagellar hook assembly protein FlgD